MQLFDIVSLIYLIFSVCESVNNYMLVLHTHLRVYVCACTCMTEAYTSASNQHYAASVTQMVLSIYCQCHLNGTGRHEVM